MSTDSELKLYLVANGEAFPESQVPERGDSDSLLVAAVSAEAALQLADEFDNGRIEEKEMMWGGRKISVVMR